MGRKKVKELYPGHAADLARQERRVAAHASANADPLPGALLDAFVNVPEVVAGLTVRRLVHYDFAIFRQMKSTILRQLERAMGGGGPGEPFTDEDGYVMVYQLTRPVRDVMELLAKEGPDGLKRAALEAIGLRLGPVEVSLLMAGVQKAVVTAFSSKVSYGPASQPGGEDGSVFSQPPAEGMKTGSAGGSSI